MLCGLTCHHLDFLDAEYVSHVKLLAVVLCWVVVEQSGVERAVVVLVHHVVLGGTYLVQLDGEVSVLAGSACS